MRLCEFRALRMAELDYCVWTVRLVGVLGRRVRTVLLVGARTAAEGAVRHWSIDE